jgi:hypothetical protein
MVDTGSLQTLKVDGGGGTIFGFFFSVNSGVSIGYRKNAQMETSIIMTAKAREAYLDWGGVLLGVVSRTVPVDFRKEVEVVALGNTPWSMTDKKFADVHFLETKSLSSPMAAMLVMSLPLL